MNFLATVVKKETVPRNQTTVNSSPTLGMKDDWVILGQAVSQPNSSQRVTIVGKEEAEILGMFNSLS